MTESTMPVTEAAVQTDERERTSYELAYHVLPTVAEGEVASVTSALKEIITKAGGEVFDEENAARFELAYEIEKYLEGRYRHFASAYFGWIRFRVEASAIAAIAEELDGHKLILRHLLIRLTRVEEETPFRFHESIVDKKVRTIDTDEDVSEADEEIVVTEEVDESDVVEPDTK